MLTDIEIATQAKTKPISQIAKNLAIEEKNLEYYGHTKAKVCLDYLQNLPENPNSKLILVTAISPTPAGEGKTTTTVGLGDGLNRIGKKTTICLREPSLGPCFGIKGGAAGGGYAQVVPMEDINLHFTGDFHAITSAHNLLAAAIDNHIHWGNKLKIDIRRIQWKRVIDMNDRSLRKIVSALGGKINGYPRETGFDITVASEIMAILCLAKDRQDLQDRLDAIIIGFNDEDQSIKAKDLQVSGAMSVLLKQAISPNLVQTLENNPAFIHGGPFANIAHGCNSIIAIQAALKLSDYVVTEAGFGADLGAEKFINIACKAGKFKPSAVVLVATIKALKMHGFVAKDKLSTPNVAAVRNGLENLGRHIENVKKFGLPLVVALNLFSADSQEEIDIVSEYTKKQGVETIISDHWAQGSKGAEQLAHKVVELCDKPNNFKTIYDNNKLGLFAKINQITKTLYGASGASAPQEVHNKLNQWQNQGYGNFPICMAKTPYSFSTDESLLGAPSDHEVFVRDVKLAAGAQFIIAICGNVMTMPGLPRHPSAQKIGFNKNNEIIGLF